MSRIIGTVQGYLTLLLITSAILVASQNPLVSNGTCYYAAGKEADPAYIPCGNDAFGVYACCMNGDKCLSSSSCYNAEYGNVYIAGCTDPTYSDPTCDQKGLYSDLQWVSLVRCYVSNDTNFNNEEWAPCSESHQPVVSSHDGGCVCTASAHTAVFTDNPVLTNYAVLPASTGMTISWQPGHTPPSDLKPTASSGTSTTSPSSSGATSSIPSETSTANPSSPTTSTATSNNDSLSTAAEIGIGVGVGISVLLICAALFLFYRRRQQKKLLLEHQNPSKEPFISPVSMQSAKWSNPAPAQYHQEFKAELPVPDRPQPQPSELAGSTQPGKSGLHSANVSEVDGTSTIGASPGVVSPVTGSNASAWGGSDGNGPRDPRSSQGMDTRIHTVHELQ